MSEVMAIGPWKNNAELIADVARLGYLDVEGATLDCTYGEGKFWTKWRPDNLIGTDIDPAKSFHGASIDFTNLPFNDGQFDQVVIDGPYKLNGTSTGKGSSAMDEGYGVSGKYVKWQDRITLICRGIAECARVLAPKGHLLIKGMDQVCSGKVRWQVQEFVEEAEFNGCYLVDMFHIKSHRAQPDGRRQLHARRNYSTLLVCRKG